MPAACEGLVVAGQPFLRGGVHERGVGDAGDPAVTEREEMLDGAARAGDVVDIDARAGHVGQGALEDDREARH